MITADEVTNIINNISLTSIQQCNSNIDVSQIVVISGNDDVIQNVLVNQNVQANIQCFGQVRYIVAS